MDRDEMAATAGMKLKMLRRSTPHPTEHRGLYQKDLVDDDAAPRGLNQKSLSDLENGRCAYLVDEEVLSYLAERYGRSVDEVTELVVLTYTPEAEQRLVRRQDKLYHQSEALKRAIQRFADEEAA